MALSILDIALQLGAKKDDGGGINASEFDRLGLPFFAGCECCCASLAPYNAFPSITGYIRCKDCVDGFAYDDIADFLSDTTEGVAIEKGTLV